MNHKMSLLVALGALVLPFAARAEDSELDVHAFEYVDVIETADGSIWKGVVVEQTPNVQFKIATSDGSLHVIKAADVVKLTKQRNRDYRPPMPAAREQREDGVASRYEGGGGLPPPYAQSGARLEPDLAFVFPTGPLGDLKFPTSFAPGAHIGYEQLFGNFGLGGGGHLRFTYFRLPGETSDTLWTLETQLYARAALHIGRAMPYAGVTFGLDTNYVYSSAQDMSNTSVGFGMNLQAGLAVAATPALALELGGDYHPGTDTISDLAHQNESVSYFALRVGAVLRM